MTMQTTQQTMPLSLELALTGHSDLDAAQWMNQCMEGFWRRKLEHIRSLLTWQESQRSKLSPFTEGKSSHNRYLDNMQYFRGKASCIEEGYNAWLNHRIQEKPELAQEMNHYLYNNCPNPLVKPIHGIPDGLLKFVMVMTTKIKALRALFQEFAPDASEIGAAETRQRKYDFSSAIFFNVMELLASVWGEAIHGQMVSALSQSRPELVVAVLEETILLYDETRSFAGRMRLLQQISKAASLPAFEEVKKPDTLFKAFAYDQLLALKNQLQPAEYRQASNELKRQFGELWNRHAASLAQQGPSSDAARILDEMMENVQESLVTGELKSAVHSKNQRYGEGMRSLRQKMQKAAQAITELDSDEEATPDQARRARQALEEARLSLAARQNTMVSLETPVDGERSLEDTLALEDENNQLETPEDFTQELWDEFNPAQKAYLVLTSLLAEGANGKDGMHSAFAEASGIADVRNIVVNNIIRQIVQKLADEAILPFTSRNYRLLFAQLTETVRKRGLQRDLTITLGMLISQSCSLLEADEANADRRDTMDEIKNIVYKVMESMQWRKTK